LVVLITGGGEVLQRGRRGSKLLVLLLHSRPLVVVDGGGRPVAVFACVGFEDAWDLTKEDEVVAVDVVTTLRGAVPKE
jgi:hypothetical protein